MAVPTTSSSNTATRLRSASLSRAPSNSTVSRPPSPRSGSADPMKRKETPKTSREAPMRPLTNGKIRTAPENPRMSKPPTPMSKAKSEQAMLAELTAKKMETEKRLAESEAENGRLRREQEDAKVRERDLQKELEYAMKREKELEGKLAQSKEDLMSSDIRARKCLNDLLNLKGQIRIVTRTRPLMPDERKAAITYPGPERIEIQHKQDKYAYEFQKVMGPNYTQAAVFDEIGELILNVLHGFNVAIIAYGQTGSGKTYTMRGGSDCDTQGVIPRAVNYLFQNTKRLEDIGWKFDLSASFVEVYNDEVFDLLSKTRNKITLKTMGLEYTEGLTVKTVQGKEHIEAILAQADKTRSVGTTKLNMSSSRSHAIFKLTVRSENTILQAEHTSSLHLVDLAGSERVKESRAEGSVLKEAAEINESLFHFQFCIRSLLEQKHVPFRNRTLTKLLSSCLAANDSKTMVVINLNPSQSQTAETKRSLDFARDMSKVEIKEVKPRR